MLVTIVPDPVEIRAKYKITGLVVAQAQTLKR
jgi:hypothetical protein